MTQLSGALTLELDLDRLADLIADRVNERLDGAHRQVAAVLDDGLTDPDDAGILDRVSDLVHQVEQAPRGDLQYDRDAPDVSPDAQAGHEGYRMGSRWDGGR